MIAATITVSTILTILIVFAICAGLYYAARHFMPGMPANIAGIVLGIIFLWVALRAFGLLSDGAIQI